MQRDKITERPYLFRSYPHPSPSNESTSSLHCPQINGDDVPIWKVARATIAAPFYFRPLQMQEDRTNAVYIDGGFGANNPSEQVYASIQELSDDAPQSVRTLVSIGTGKPPHSGSRERAVVKLSNSNLRWIPRFIGSAIVQATNSETIHQSVRRQVESNGVQYFRLNVEEGIGSIKLDEFKGKNGCKTLRQINDATGIYLATNEKARNRISALAHLLVNIRWARAYLPNPGVSTSQNQTRQNLTQEVQDAINVATEDVLHSLDTTRCQDRWEIFVHGVVYCCKFKKKCDWTKEKTGNRQELHQHYIIKHGDELRSSEIEGALDGSRKYPIRESAARNKNEEGGAMPSRRTTYTSC